MFHRVEVEQGGAKGLAWDFNLTIGLGTFRAILIQTINSCLLNYWIMTILVTRKLSLKTTKTIAFELVEHMLLCRTFYFQQKHVIVHAQCKKEKRSFLISMCCLDALF